MSSKCKENRFDGMAGLSAGYEIQTYDKKPTPAELRKKRFAARERFKRARLAEKIYARRLRGVAKQVGNIVRGFAPDGVVRDPSLLSTTLARYAQLIEPWARRVAASMIGEVGQRDLKAWSDMGRELGLSIHAEIATAPTGHVTTGILAEQVALITSLPIEAAERVHSLTLEAMSTSTRAADIAQEILRTGLVIESRAMLIARTEVGRTAGAFTQARAVHVGSEGYIWRTAGDADVRPYLGMPSRQRARFIGSHRALEGKYIRWGKPPVSGQSGEHAHAGMIYNCRCWMEPVMPDRI